MRARALVREALGHKHFSQNWRLVLRESPNTCTELVNYAAMTGKSTRNTSSAQGPHDEDSQHEAKTKRPGKREQEPPKKKRKVAFTPQPVGLLGPGWEHCDATALVPHYTQMNQVPKHLRKCAS
jgi:hypothetical protein